MTSNTDLQWLDEIIVRLIDCAKHENKDGWQFGDRCITKWQAKAAIAAKLASIELKARLVELDMLEQAINSGSNIQGHKLLRLEDLTARLDQLAATEELLP